MKESQEAFLLKNALFSVLIPPSLILEQIWNENIHKMLWQQ
jgi:hypothetical protein